MALEFETIIREADRVFVSRISNAEVMVLVAIFADVIVVEKNGREIRFQCRSTFGQIIGGVIFKSELSNCLD